MVVVMIIVVISVGAIPPVVIGAPESSFFHGDQCA